MRTFLGSETASAGSKNRVSAVAIAPFAHGEKGFHEMERLRGPLRQSCKDKLGCKSFLYFLIILSLTHNHASLEMSDEPEGLPVRDEVASIVTMLQCYMLHVTLRFARPRHCIIPRKTDPPLRLNGNASFFVRFLVQGCKSAISSTFPPVSPKVKTQVLIIIYLGSTNLRQVLIIKKLI